VSSAIIGATRIEQLEENLKASEIRLKDSEWRAAEAAIRGPARASARKPAARKSAKKKKR
jgi:aryl-alcohol dehydrogenase-like predicted oxidoreductase